MHQNADNLFDYATYKCCRKIVTNFQAKWYETFICTPICLWEDVVSLYCYITEKRCPLVLKLVLLKFSVKPISTLVTLASHSNAREELHSRTAWIAILWETLFLEKKAYRKTQKNMSMTGSGTSSSWSRYLSITTLPCTTYMNFGPSYDQKWTQQYIQN